MSFDATVGGTQSTSNVSLADVAAYFESSLNNSVYLTWGEDRIKLLAMVATKQLNWYFEWIGFTASDTQALSWPRKRFGLDFDRDKYEDSNEYNGLQLDKDPLDGETIPQLLKDATCELMLVLHTDSNINLTYSSIEELKVGPINIKFGNNVQSGGFPKHIIEMLKRIGAYIVGQSNSLQVIRLNR